jgi:hypothetical protein
LKGVKAMAFDFEHVFARPAKAQYADGVLVRTARNGSSTPSVAGAMPGLGAQPVHLAVKRDIRSGPRDG